MDRLGQLRSEAGGSRDTSLDVTSTPSEAFLTANESSKYFSLPEDDSTCEISPIKDVSLASASVPADKTITDTEDLLSNLSPIGKKSDMLDSFKIGKQIEAANILSGGVNIFDDNDNSYDGNELIIDDNVDEKSNQEIQLTESVQFKIDNATESTIVENETAIASKDTEVVLQIDGRNVDAIDIGNGLYLYRKQGQEELAAVQIIDDDQQQPSFKFLKVRENAEGNLEVYEEIEIEVTKEVPVKERKMLDKNLSHVPVKDINKVTNEPTCNKVVDKINKVTQKEITVASETESEGNKEITDSKSEVNLNGKMMKFSESRKSPVIGTFTPMTFHSTPNKEGVPLTKTMVDLQLHPSRHSDNVKKTIEVHTDSSKQRLFEPQIKNRESEVSSTENEKEISSLTALDIQSGIKLKDEVSHNNKKEVNLETINAQSKLSPSKNISITEKVPEITLNIDKPEKEHEANKNTSLKEIAITGNQNKNKIDKASVITCPSIKQSNDDTDLDSVVEKENPKQCKIANATDVQTKQKEDKNVTAIKVTTSECDSNEKLPNCKDIISEEVLNSTEMKKVKVDSTPMQEKVVRTTFKEENLDKKAILVENTSVSHNIEENTNHSEIIVDLFEKTKPSVVDSATKRDSKHPSQTNLLSKSNIEKEESNAIDTNVEKPIENIKISPAETLKDIKTDANTTNNTILAHVGKEQDHAINTMKKIDKNIEQNSEVTKTSQLKEKPTLIEIENTDNKKIDPISQNIVDKSTSSKLAKPSHVPKLEQTKSRFPVPENSVKQNNAQKEARNKMESKEIPKATTNIESKPINNNAAVPFGKWTEANRQEFLNKIKETKVPVHSSNGKQIKNSNDLNRREFLKKIDVQRQSTSNNASKTNVKNDAVFSNKAMPAVQDSKIPVKNEAPVLKVKSIINKKITKPEIVNKTHTQTSTTIKSANSITKKETLPRRQVDVMNAQDLIDKTIEGMINRAGPTKPSQENKQSIVEKDETVPKQTNPSYSQESTTEPSLLDAIEIKMNELHGIPFVERPPHELPIFKPEDKSNDAAKSDKDIATNKSTKIPNLLPFTNKNQQNTAKENIDLDSEEEIIEHEPVTGDIESISRNTLQANKETTPEDTKVNNDLKTDTVITEKDFDKFARRNSITYENCLTVNFDRREPHNVIQTIVEKDIAPMTYSKNEISSVEIVPKTALKHKDISVKKIETEDSSNKNYQSKLQMAYQSVLTAKRQSECPITIIEDKPVKVVFVDSNTNFSASLLNVQGQELSPAKKPVVDDVSKISTLDKASEYNDSDALDTDDNKSQDEIKTKTKHQRKQVLTSVETPELELIEPSDLGFKVSPKKKRKTEDKADKSLKSLVHKKSYLLGRNVVPENKLHTQDVSKNINKELSHRNEGIVGHSDAVSAIDNLVKAAELLDNQSLSLSTSTSSPNPDSQNTPVKRGRGRPRKYPLPDGTGDKNKVPSPQKKPRLTEVKVIQSSTDTDEDSTDEGIVAENWTMGKINENIVCPICNKLFRSENVVFKHVKHCTGPSPSRSDADKSPRRMRQSQESDDKSHDSKSYDMEVDEEKINDSKGSPKKRKSKDSVAKSDHDINEIIVIEDTPRKGKQEIDERKQHESRTTTKVKITSVNSSSLVCEICGKSFRQLSYLASHKLQHKKEEKDRAEKVEVSTKSVFSCEVCKKDFRKLHHLVQHRIIHNPAMTSRTSRKSSLEQHDNKPSKEQKGVKQSDDQSAGFRCEPCDKSFRKLHHLVEHRETHDGINRQKITSTAQTNVEKPTLPPQCEICKKTFRKLHHLIEHKELHLETSSEKSDDKSVKSSLSTRDIIHECSLCYMVFPNEHSLTKHTVICQKKKRQSKQPKAVEDVEMIGDVADIPKTDETDVQDMDDPVIVTNTSDIIVQEPEKQKEDTPKLEIDEPEKPIIVEDTPKKIEDMPKQEDIIPVKSDITQSVIPKPEISEAPDNDSKPGDKEVIVIKDTPKKKIHIKEKTGSTVSKKQKTSNLTQSKVEKKSNIESNDNDDDDDDEIRYMFNPNHKSDETSEGKVFMKVRAKKRNSLQIERPNSKDLVKRRTSLQHPPKIPRLKPKSVETKVDLAKSNVKNVVKTQKLEPLPSTDSDDSDVKYSFPETVPKKSKPSPIVAPKPEKKMVRKSVADKRKSLSAIAKRKSLGKVPAPKQKAAIPQVKRRITEAEHRCDCGQLFSSAALLSRHTTLAHTPPRIRKRRSPPPDIDTKTVIKPPPRKTSVVDKTKQNALRKSSVKSDTTTPNITKTSVSTRQSSVARSEVKMETRKSNKPEKSETKPVSNIKLRKSTAHSGVPVPEKMKKIMQKSKK